MVQCTSMGSLSTTTSNWEIAQHDVWVVSMWVCWDHVVVAALDTCVLLKKPTHDVWVVMATVISKYDTLWEAK